MALTLYRIDGIPRTYSQLFPKGAGALYDDYGVQPFTGQPCAVQLPQRSTLRLAQSTRANVPGISTVRCPQTAATRLPQRSTLRIPKE
jgi:hypothetical protein